MAHIGPSGFSPYPVAVYEGILNPPPGKALLFNEIVDEEIAMREAAKAMLTRENPTIFPGPQVLYAWNEEAKEKAKLVRKMAEVLGAKIIPMYDYRPKYPKINPAIEINPNHPNLTIWHNKIKACIFVGVHCHYANVALKIIRAETDCFTIAMCGMAGHEDAMITLRDQHVEEMEKFIKVAEEVKKELGK
ncbi:carbon monoxide dehydrogenase beta subunit family protein [Hydrogenobacter hydrogenophilus]|uniref:CO dehydrogenase beta subunit/acetyl-CoA synthase epsilon subunit n=1 Tax=Hydrogenobacter hydrogenophilus TaxID=35835 RepID=A0A285NWJ3_9AQUI|nr:carbon monoxide dehydrogenase beta subunit family protein [Hydrogenobacter hydrogenophilus]SNZ13854.1 CO dehydrogenase beta subunit/acetyl-CoA synthase epsilon subunit [Hydrogenobacter hydrogenophilus]